MPEIDVVMPVYNAARYIDEAVTSILMQTFADFRLIIVDDHSDDGTSVLLSRFSESDKRVTVITSTGRGIVDALNRGISVGSSPFIARMDADDISDHKRLSVQLEYMKDKPDVVLLGSAMSIFGSLRLEPSVISTDSRCRLAMRLFSPFCHPTVIMRRESITAVGGYSHLYPWAEDYDLFVRLAQVGKIDNLNARLLRYRSHPGQVSVTRRHEQWQSAKGISGGLLNSEGVSGFLGHFQARCIAMLQLGPEHLKPSLRALRNHLLLSSSD